MSQGLNAAFFFRLQKVGEGTATVECVLYVRWSVEIWKRGTILCIEDIRKLKCFDKAVLPAGRAPKRKPVWVICLELTSLVKHSGQCLGNYSELPAPQRWRV